MEEKRIYESEEPTVGQMWERTGDLWKQGKVKVDHDHRPEEVRDWRTRVTLEGKFSDIEREAYRILCEKCGGELADTKARKDAGERLTFEFKFGEGYQQFMGRYENDWQEKPGQLTAREIARRDMGLTEETPLGGGMRRDIGRKIMDGMPGNVKGHSLTEKEKEALLRGETITVTDCTEGTCKPYTAEISMELEKKGRGVKPVLKVNPKEFTRTEETKQSQTLRKPKAKTQGLGV
ncbi:MAG: hypothetical protein MJZ00_05265 [Paludibacteraceae bacterium]|nr:hypothetical protein [Paludibacteraceae bacterium]